MSHENPRIRAKTQVCRARVHCHARESMSPRAPRALQGCLLGWAASSYFFESVPPLAYIFVQVPLDPPLPPRFSSQLPSQFQKSRCHGRGLCVHRSFIMVALFRASASRARLPGVEAQMPHRASSAGFARRHTSLARDAHHSREGCTLRNITRISCL